MRHEFESGDWVEVVPVQDLKHKHRTRFLRMTRSWLTFDDNDDLDKQFIRDQGGVAIYNINYAERQLAVLTALVVTAWSYAAPVPQLTDGGELIDAASMDETDVELETFLQPHLRKLMREAPDPKEATTSSSNGRSKASARSLKA